MTAIMPFDYVAMAAIADQLIQEFGMVATLRRVGIADRSCFVVVPDFLPRDQQSQLSNPTERMVLISATYGGVPALPPNNELDQLITYVQPAGTIVDEILAFTGSPVKLYKPAGTVVLYQATVKR